MSAVDVNKGRQASAAVVGAGLTGTTIAHELRNAGWRVRVLERELQAGGACATRWVGDVACDLHAPHFYHTRSRERWDYVQKFAKFNGYKLVRKVRFFGGGYVTFPPDETTLARYSDEKPATKTDGFESAIEREVGTEAYRELYLSYTEKHWGVPPWQLSAELAKRIDRKRDTELSFPDEFQGVPMDGWTNFIDVMLGDVERRLGVDVGPSIVGSLLRSYDVVFYTGCLEDLFPDDPRRLPYRGQRQETAVRPWTHPAAVINHSNSADDVPLREYCWTWVREDAPPATDVPAVVGASYAAPTPKLYPVPVVGAEETYGGLLERCLREWRGRVVPCGRLGMYKYLDMDDAVKIALDLSRIVVEGKWPDRTTEQIALIARLRRKE